MEESVTPFPLPTLDSIQALALFWDTHDLTDFEHALKEVTEPVFERDTAITLHLECNEVGIVHQMASRRGVADTELIHEWVREKIHAA